MQRIKHSTLFSLALHGLLLFIIFGKFNIKIAGGGGGDSEKKQESSEKEKGEDHKNKYPEQETIEDKPMEARVLTLGESKALENRVLDIEKKKAEKLKKVGNCDRWFGGIGVNIDYSTGRETVVKVHDGYPASEAGILEGDIIDEMASDVIRGEIGTNAKIVVIRNGQVIEFNIIRGKICSILSEKKP